jgi:hypothetical protein
VVTVAVVMEETLQMELMVQQILEEAVEVHLDKEEVLAELEAQE